MYLANAVYSGQGVIGSKVKMLSLIKHKMISGQRHQSQNQIHSGASYIECCEVWWL